MAIFNFYLFEAFILADQLANLPLREASSVQEWQYEISTVRAHIDRPTGRFTTQ